MRVAVTTPTGNVGRVLTGKLLDAGAELTLLCRDPGKVAPFTERGATALAGSLEDAEYVREATRGADVLFWVTPPKHDSQDYRADQLALGDVAAAAIEANEIPRVVNLSSVGVHLPSGVGPILGLAEIERKIDAVATNVIHLRPNVFMENFLGSLPSIKSDGCVFLPVSGQRSAGFIATRDVASFAALKILDDSWEGKSNLEVHGPSTPTFDQVAEILGQGLGETIRHVQVEPEQALEAMVAMGMAENVAQGIVDIYTSLERVELGPSRFPTPDCIGRTSFPEFVREVFVPLAVG